MSSASAAFTSFSVSAFVLFIRTYTHAWHPHKASKTSFYSQWYSNCSNCGTHHSPNHFNLLALEQDASGYDSRVEKRLKLLSREQWGGFLVESLLFAMFFIAMLFLLTLRDPASNWAMVPNVLCNLGLFILVTKHFMERRPPLYWSHFDAVVVVLFAIFIANVYYSEIRVTSWRIGSLYLNAFAAFFFGRMLFYHRVRGFVISLVIALITVYALCYFLNQKLLASAQENDLRLAVQIQQTMRVVSLFGLFWAISLPFLLFKKPSNLLFLLYVAILLTVYAFFVWSRLNWLFLNRGTGEGIALRHEKYLTLQTALRIIRNYPFFGSGLGTFPVLFEAYKQSPHVPYATGFNSYLYCAVETGIFGLILFLYFLIRFPLHIMRRWKLFPNRRLRMAIFVFFFFLLLVFLQGLFDADMFAPATWFLIWTNVGILVGLVMVRDPLRIFDAPFFETRRWGSAAKGAPGWTAPARRTVGQSAKWILTRNALLLFLIAALVVSTTVAQALPYIAAQMARKKETEEVDNPAYGERLKRSIDLYPLLPNVWAKLANHYQKKIDRELEIYTQSDEIAAAYKNAIKLNPYDPRNYEQLAFLYTDTNNPTAALEVLKEGVMNNPNHFVLRMLLVRELEKQGSLALATYHALQALNRIAPERVELNLRLAELYELRGMRNKAMQYFQYAQQVVPDTPELEARMRRLRARIMVNRNERTAQPAPTPRATGRTTITDSPTRTTRSR